MMRRYRSLTYPTSTAALLVRLYRYAGACCAAIIVFLLLIQPILCSLHCLLHITHHQGPTDLGDPLQIFVCATPEPPVSHELLIPAFWPGVLPNLAVLISTLFLLRYLTMAAPPSLNTRSHPPLPPPPLTYATT